MSKSKIVLSVTVILLIVGVAVAILLARGYTLDIRKKTISQTGILVTTSDPDGAEVFINGALTTATNNTLNLEPGKYDVRIQKDGFNSWEKKVNIVKDEVFKTNAFLFPKVANLTPITFSGAINPTLSPDGTKLAFAVASASGEKSGLWVLDMSRNIPLLSGGDLRQVQISSPFLNLTDHKFLWSSDSKQILAYSTDNAPTLATPSAKAVYLLNTDQKNDTPKIVNSEQKDLLSSWDEAKNSIHQAQINKLPTALKNFLATSSANLEFSADESKIMYQATSSATLPKMLTYHLAGTNPTPEIRNITPGKIYVYDIKEDKNYLLTDCSLNTIHCSWFPSSRHILTHSDREVSLMEFDGSNKSTIYSGPFVPKLIFPWPNWSKVIILTSFNGSSEVAANLYTINLR